MIGLADRPESVCRSCASKELSEGLRHGAAVVASCRLPVPIQLDKRRQGTDPNLCGARRTPSRQRPSMPEGTYQMYRVEHDTMGEVRLPGEALWPAQAQRRGELS